MKYKQQKFLEFQQKVVEANLGISIALRKIVLDVFESDEKIAEEQFTRGYLCGYERGYADGYADGSDVFYMNKGYDEEEEE